MGTGTEPENVVFEEDSIDASRLRCSGTGAFGGVVYDDFPDALGRRPDSSESRQQAGAAEVRQQPDAAEVTQQADAAEAGQRSEQRAGAAEARRPTGAAEARRPTGFSEASQQADAAETPRAESVSPGTIDTGTGAGWINAGRAAAAGRIVSVAAVAGAVAAALFWYGNRHDYFDLRIYMSAMRWWADGHELYDYAQPDRVQGALYFTYPPFTALLLRPFAAAPITVTIDVFTALTALALVVTTWWLVAPIADRHGWPRWYAAGLAIPLAFLIEPSRETITFGQINMLLIVLILADLLFLVPNDSRLAGIGVGLATALKLFPGIFIVYLLLSRRWRASLVAGAAACGATLFAAAVAPRASWQFWTAALWDTDRVGRTDYTGNQSLLGLLSRLVAPDEPNRLIWLSSVALVAGYGLFKAARAARSGDDLAGLTLTGLVGVLVSPITWPHHVYWFIPAVLVLVDRGFAEGMAAHRRLAPLASAAAVYAGAVYGVVSFTDYGTAKLPTATVADFLIRNLYVLLALALVAALPTAGRGRGETPRWHEAPRAV